MLNLPELQHQFLNYVQGKPSSIESEIQPCHAVSSQARLNIYATGYRLRLKEAMMTDFDRLASYLGDDLFDQLVDMYITRYPSTCVNLRYYSQYMLTLITEEAPFNGFPELLELAQIEQAFTHSFDAADNAPIALERLIEVPAEDWPKMHFVCHSSVQLLQHAHNSVQIWQALAHAQNPPELIAEAQHWLVWRRDLISEYRCLDMAEAQMLHMLLAGACFGEMCESLLAFYSEEQTPLQAVTWLQQWIQDQLIIGLSVGVH